MRRGGRKKRTWEQKTEDLIFLVVDIGFDAATVAVMLIFFVTDCKVQLVLNILSLLQGSHLMFI